MHVLSDNRLTIAADLGLELEAPDLDGACLRAVCDVKRVAAARDDDMDAIFKGREGKKPRPAKPAAAVEPLAEAVAVAAVAPVAKAPKRAKEHRDVSSIVAAIQDVSGSKGKKKKAKARDDAAAPAHRPTQDKPKKKFTMM